MCEWPDESNKGDNTCTIKIDGDETFAEMEIEEKKCSDSECPSENKHENSFYNID